MGFVNNNNYVERKTKGGGGTNSNLWLVNHSRSIILKLKFPEEFIGKRIRIKIEEVTEIPKLNYNSIELNV